MATVTKQILLKVFSGPHVGAEIPLSDGEYLIGSGDECDILLNDRTIAEKHARLVVRGEEVQCESLEAGKVLIEGKESAGARLDFFQYFTLGNTHLAVGPSDETWPNREFPDFQLNSPAVVAPIEPAVDEPVASENDEADQIGAQTTEGEQGIDSQPARKPSMRSRWIIAASQLAMLTCGWFAVLYLTGFFNSSEPESLTVTLDELREVIAELAPNASVDVAEEDEAFVATGYVSDRQTEVRLEDALLELDPSIDTSGIRNTESLATSVKSILSMHKLRLTVSAGKPGEVIVEGTVSDSEKWRRAKSDIEKDTQVAWLTDEVAVPLGKKPEQAPVAVASVAPVQAEEQPEPKMQDSRQIVASDGGLASLIAGLTIGRNRFVTLRSGENVSEGGVIGSGYVIEEIEPDRVILARDGEQLLVDLGVTR